MTVDGVSVTISASDYTVGYENNTDAGEATVEITPTGGNCTGSATATFEIVPREISAEQKESFVYNGSEREVSFFLSDYIDGHVPGYEIVEGGKGINAGTYTATIRLTGPDAGNYCLPDITVQSGCVMMMSAPSGAGAVYEVEWEISKLSIDGAEVTLDQHEYTYSGSENQPGVVSVVIDGITLDASDYSIDYEDNIDARTARVIITARSSNFTGEATEGFTIHKKTIYVSLVQSQFTYDGEKQGVEVAGIAADLVPSDVGKVYVVFVSGNAGTDAEEYTAALKLDGERSHNYKLSSYELKWEIQKRHVVLTSGSDEKTYDGQPLTVDSFTVGGDRFVNGHGAELTYTGTQTDAGSSENTFTYVLTGGATSDNYDIEVSYGTLTVSKKSIADGIVNLADGTWTYDGNEKRPDVISVTIDGLTMDSGFDVVYEDNVHAGTATVKVIAGKDGNFTGTAVGTFEIGKASVTFESGSGEKVYDGTPLTATDTPEITAGQLYGDDGFSFTVTGTLTGVGSVDNSFTVTPVGDTRADDYEITHEFGMLTVSERKLSQGDFVFRPGGDKYTGSPITGTLSPSGWTPAIDDYEVYYSDNINAGTAKVTVTAKGGNCTGSVEYTWTISKRTVILTSASDSKVYDGTPLTDDGISVGGDGFAAGEGATYSFTGTQTYVGSSANRFTYELNEGTDADNYVITTQFGTLAVTAAGALIVTADSADKTYDGTPLTDGGWTLTSGTLVDGDELVVTVSGSQTSVGYSHNKVDSVKVMRGDLDVTSSYGQIGMVDGILTVSQRALSESDFGFEPDGSVYTGSEITGTLAAIGWTPADGDYGVFYSNNVNAGTATITVTAIGDNCRGSVVYTWKIAPAPISGADVAGVHNVEYTGSAITFDGIEVTLNGKGLVSGTDYEVSYTDNTNAGDAEVTIVGEGNYSGSITKSFTIERKEINVSLVQNEFTYSGQELKVTHTYAGVVDSDRAHVTVSIVSGGTGKDAGDYTAVIGLSGTKADNYVLSESSKELSWSIAPKEVTPYLEQDGFTYNGKPHTVTVIVSGILNGEAYVKIEGGGSGTAPGSYTVRFSLEGEGKDNYTLTTTELQWTIGKLSLAGADVEITGEYTYTGSKIEPEMTVTVNGLTLAESDYDVSYSDNINAGTVNVTVKAKGTSSFTGEAHGTFEIKKKPVSVLVSDIGFTYDGKEHTVTVKLSEAIEGITLVIAGDLKGTSAGSYDVTLSLEGEGSGNYVLDIEGFTWTISKRSLQDADISLKGDLTYTGSQICPGVIVKIGDLTLEEGIDYEVSYGDNRNVSDGGTVTITAVGNGNFAGEKTAGFDILRKEVDVSLSLNSFVYDGHEKSVTLSYDGIVDGGVSVVTAEGSILSATQAGTYTVYLSLSGEGSGNYCLSEDSLTWTIGRLNLGGSGADIDIGGDFVYCASQIKPVVTVTVGDVVLKEGTDYEVSYGENIYAGQGSVTITALDGGSLDGSKTIGFTIEKRPVHVILGETSFEYSGSEHTVSVSVNGSDILNDEVRLVTGGTPSAIQAGTYTVNLSLEGEMEGNYALDIKEFTWTIDGKSISDADVDVSDEVYTGSAITPDVTVKVDGTPLVEGTDYTLTYHNNIKAGEGSVTITANGNYVGSIIVSFDIARKPIDVSLVDDSFDFDGTKHSVVLDHISGIATGDDVHVSLEGDTHATHAGKYHVKVVMAGADAGNYYLRTTGFTWVIEQRGLHDAVVSLVNGSTYTYTGSQIMPKVTITVGGMTPEKGTDYSVSYSNNIDVGTAKVIITAKENGDYAGFISVNFEIAKKVLEPVLSEGSFVYDGKEHTAELGDLSASIAQGDDLKVHLKGTISATDAGTYHVKAVMEGSDARNYLLNVTAFIWIIEKADLGSAHVTVPDGLIHTGSAVEPDVVVEFGGMTLVVGRDYTLSYADNVDAGRASVTVTAVKDGNFHGTVTVGFDIGRAHLDLVAVAEPEDAVYHGSAHTPEISVEYNGLKLIEGTHYTVEYHDNIEAGTATVVLRAVDGSNFTGYRHLTFNILSASVDGFGIDDVDDRVYTGSPIEPGISAVFNGAPLTEWEDYVLRYADNTDAGTAVIIIEGRGNFFGVREIRFTIAPAFMGDVSIAPVPDQMYTGTDVRPGITAALNGLPLVEGEDYILSYVGDTVNVTGDCVYVVAEGIGNLAGTVSIPYRIVYDGLQDITGITVNGYTGVYDGSEHIAVTVTGTMQGDKVSYSTDGTTFVSDVPTVTHVSDSGVVWVKVERPGCVPTMFGVSVTVAPAGLTVESSSVQGMYDGEPLTGHEVTIVNGQLFGDDGFAWVFSGQQTAPGSSANTFVPAALPGTEAGDYIITLVYGTLTVDQSAISENSSWVLALILAIGIAAASYHGIMWVSGGRPLEALSALASRLASAIRRE